MSIILATLTAAALTRAAPATYPGTWVSDIDYPAEAQRQIKRGISSFLLLISTKGKVVRCYITQPSGSPELDKRACVLMSVRGVFKPATDENGTPVYDTHEGRINWRHADRPNRDLRPAPEQDDDADLELQVTRLPNSLLQQRVALIVRMDTSGHVAYCEPTAAASVPPSLAAAACTQAKAGYISVTKDESDQPAAVIRTLDILFKVPTNEEG
jgi:hypothetical protein